MAPAFTRGNLVICCYKKFKRYKFSFFFDKNIYYASFYYNNTVTYNFRTANKFGAAK